MYMQLPGTAFALSFGVHKCDSKKYKAMTDKNVAPKPADIHTINRWGSCFIILKRKR